MLPCCLRALPISPYRDASRLFLLRWDVSGAAPAMLMFDARLLCRFAFVDALLYLLDACCFIFRLPCLCSLPLSLRYLEVFPDAPWYFVAKILFRLRCFDAVWYLSAFVACSYRSCPPCHIYACYLLCRLLSLLLIHVITFICRRCCAMLLLIRVPDVLIFDAYGAARFAVVCWERRLSVYAPCLLPRRSALRVYISFCCCPRYYAPRYVARYYLICSLMLFAESRASCYAILLLMLTPRVSPRVCFSYRYLPYARCRLLLLPTICFRWYIYISRYSMLIILLMPPAYMLSTLFFAICCCCCSVHYYTPLRFVIFVDFYYAIIDLCCLYFVVDALCHYWCRQTPSCFTCRYAAAQSSCRCFAIRLFYFVATAAVWLIRYCLATDDKKTFWFLFLPYATVLCCLSAFSDTYSPRVLRAPIIRAVDYSLFPHAFASMPSLFALSCYSITRLAALIFFAIADATPAMRDALPDICAPRVYDAILMIIAVIIPVLLIFHATLAIADKNISRFHADVLSVDYFSCFPADVVICCLRFIFLLMLHY